jgi:UDP-N-acetylmuramoyl-L-alanyl-D-glutamate--2,6-diaminopimelate ligase
MNMLLSALLRDVNTLQIEGPIDPDVHDVHFDSRKVQTGDLFVAVVGTRVDGHKFISTVLEGGAKVIVCEEIPDQRVASTTYVQVESSSQALGLIANAYYGQPSEQLTLIGVTGTNGKTTTASLLFRLFEILGFKVGLLSTIQNYVGDDIVASTHTTGDAIQIAQLLARMVDAGCTHCFMEVTSHAIDQNRIAGLNFDGAIFTNLTHDHLDYHGTFDAYRRTKKSYFDSLPPNAFALINIDDPSGTLMGRDTLARKFSYGSKPESEFLLAINHKASNGLQLTISGQPIQSRLVGDFNAYNLAGVFGAAKILGADTDDLLRAIPTLDPVEGRMERVDGSGDIMAVVDFAHTPDALEKTLATLRASNPVGPLICVVGCGGDRDKEKRPVMAKIAACNSDLVIFTSDNPRTENPVNILQDMLAGVPKEFGTRVTAEVDRRKAIFRACTDAVPGTLVLIAGKGHEKYQEISGKKHEFDDVKCAREALRFNK